MGKRNRIKLRIPELPVEIFAIIVEWVGVDRDLVTLKNIRGADHTLCSLSRLHSYRTIDFRGKSPSAIRLFADWIAPEFGYLVTCVLHRPIDEEAVENSNERLNYCRERDKEFAAVFDQLPNVSNLDLTIPTLEYQPLYGLTLASIQKWKLVQLTCRSKDWGRGRFNSATDAFNAKSLALLVSSYPNLQSLRALGISGLDISPDGPSIRALRDIPRLDVLKSLHLAGGYLSEFTPTFVRLKPPLTHLVLAEDSELEWEILRDLLIAVSSTLESLAIRQAGQLLNDPAVKPFKVTDLPKLKRLAIALNGEIVQSLERFVHVKFFRLEVGTNDGRLAMILAQKLTDGDFEGLKQLGFVASTIDGTGWDDIHGVCQRKGIEFEPGFMVADDFP